LANGVLPKMDAKDLDKWKKECEVKHVCAAQVEVLGSKARKQHKTTRKDHLHLLHKSYFVMPKSTRNLMQRRTRKNTTRTPIRFLMKEMIIDTLDDKSTHKQSDLMFMQRSNH